MNRNNNLGGLKDPFKRFKRVCYDSGFIDNLIMEFAELKNNTRADFIYDLAGDLLTALNQFLIVTGSGVLKGLEKGEKDLASYSSRLDEVMGSIKTQSDIINSAIQQTDKMNSDEIALLNKVTNYAQDTIQAALRELTRRREFKALALCEEKLEKLHLGEKRSPMSPKV